LIVVAENRATKRPNSQSSTSWAIYGLPYLSDCILIVRALNVFGGGKMTVAADVIDAILRHDRRAPKKIGTPTSIRREVDASLRRLGIERIDLYQMHWPLEDGTPLEGYWQTLLDLKAEGKVRGPFES
jgi:aryl-alcohol dehydrogenase-like predicted oxidoreductase